MKLDSPEILRAALARRRMSLEQLARRANCSKAMISHLTSGRKTSCTTELATAISEALSVPTDLLFEPITTTSRSGYAYAKKSA